MSDWAAKKKEQIERAKLLREERKYGSSHLKNAGETQMTPGGPVRNQNAGGFGGNGDQYNLQVPGYNGQYGQSGYNEFLSDNIPKNSGNTAVKDGRYSPANYPGNQGHSAFDLNQNNSMYDPTSASSATPTHIRSRPGGLGSNGYDNFNQGPPKYNSIQK